MNEIKKDTVKNHAPPYAANDKEYDANAWKNDNNIDPNAVTQRVNRGQT
jgi:hypothetical protein